MTSKIDQILEKALEKKASDVHLVEGRRIRFRCFGKLEIIPEFGIADSELILSLIKNKDDQERIRSKEIHEIDFAYQLEDKNERFRVNVFRELSGLAATLRHIPSTIPKLEELGLPSSIEKVTRLRRGLVIVTGPTGSGKSTTLAAIIDRINRERNERIITIEDPVEFVHENKKSFISHRELKSHTDSFAKALRSALRQDPDIILVGEMRDLETMDLALKAALTGHLVLTTLHVISAAKAIDRIVDVFPENAKNQARSDLADVIECVISQILLPTKDSKRAVAAEVMFATTAIRNLIREGKTYQINSVIETSKKEGMTLLDEMIEKLLLDEVIDSETAFVNAVDKKRFSQYLQKSKRLSLSLS